MICADDKLWLPEMAQKSAQKTRPEPLGHLGDGGPYYAPVGQMRSDGDRVQCHLCGRWLKMVGGQHLLAAYDITTARYREMFRLLVTTSTVAPDTQERKTTAPCSSRSQVASADQTAMNRTTTGNVSRWRSLGALRPDLLPEWNFNPQWRDKSPSLSGSIPTGKRGGAAKPAAMNGKQHPTCAPAPANDARGVPLSADAKPASNETGSPKFPQTARSPCNAPTSRLSGTRPATSTSIPQTWLCVLSAEPGGAAVRRAVTENGRQ